MPNTRKVLRAAKPAPPSISKWIPFLQRHLMLRKLQKTNVGLDNLTRLSALLALFGSPDEQNAVGLELFRGLCNLLMDRERIPKWAEVIALLPPDTAVLSTFARALRAASFIEPIEAAKFDPVMFTKIALLLKDPMGYVHAFKTHQPPFLIRRAFHPNTVEWMSKTHRGLLSDLADIEHREALLADVPVIT